MIFHPSGAANTMIRVPHYTRMASLVKQYAIMKTLPHHRTWGCDTCNVAIQCRMVSDRPIQHTMLMGQLGVQSSWDQWPPPPRQICQG